MSAVTVVPTPLTQRTDALVARVDQATEVLLAKFSAISELSFEEQDSSTGRNVATAAATSLQIESHAHQMVSAAEDLRTIIREVKEAWILGMSGQQQVQEEEQQATMDLSDLDKRLKTALVQLGSKDS